ncbi:MAG: hypothetical protein ACE5GL_08845, partial [Calditrichia bacterium]
SWLERRPVTPEVASSSLVDPAKGEVQSFPFFYYGRIGKGGKINIFDGMASCWLDRPDMYVGKVSSFPTFRDRPRKRGSAKLPLFYTGVAFYPDNYLDEEKGILIDVIFF